MAGSRIIARVDSDSSIQDEADTTEIAHRYNAFPALLEALKVMLRLHYDEGTASLRGLDAVNEAEAAIAAAQRPEEGA